MTKVLLKNTLQPRYFISYSRMDSKIADAIKGILPSHSNYVWHDIDRIAIGDNWMEEIQCGIYESDEVIILVSESSAKSVMVKYEVTTAQSLDKPIRPILVHPTTSLPDFIAHIQHLDLSQSASGLGERIAKFLTLDNQ